MTENKPTLNQKPALFIGIDWADKKHDVHVITAGGRQHAEVLPHRTEAIHQWVAEMQKLASGGTIAIIIEQSRGPLIHALMHRENIVLYPINPKQFARYRESFSAGNGKSDPTDAKYLARLLRERIAILRPWVPDDKQTHLLDRLCHQRRLVVEQQTKLRQQLTSTLKQYFPLVLELFGKSHQLDLLLAVIMRWSDPRALCRADRTLINRVLKEHGVRSEGAREEICRQIRTASLLTNNTALIEPLSMMAKLLSQQIDLVSKTIKKFEERIEKTFASHPDEHLFSSLRGAGAALAPRLLCAFGSQRDRWANADELAAFSGVAPLTRQSGKQRIVQRRFACPKYLRQTFHEFADAARRWCPWSRARYEMLRDRGMKHHAALRKLARSWIRILYRVWQTRQPFDCEAYLQSLRRRLPEIVPYLEKQKKAKQAP
jgi:transposase